MNLQQHKLHNHWRKLPLWLRVVLIIAVISLIAWIVIPGALPDLPTARVESGEFVIDLNETGRLSAENSVTVSSPPVRTSLQIIELIPEGTVVKKGDVLVRFDPTELQRVIDDRSAELDIARSNLTRSEAAMKSQLASLESSVENSRASYRLSELSLDQMKFEADARIEQGKLQLQQAKISLDQAEQQLEAQKKINLEDIRSLKLKIKQAEIDLEKSLRDLEKMTVKAPSSGLVVYKEIWKGGTMGKIKVGDTPWRGQALIELPDLSVMLVETSVGEINISKVKVGLEVEIKLDAYPDPVFHGDIIDVAVLASTDEGVSEARVFKVEIRIRESDELLRPGMSASARIIVDEIPNKMWVPIEAIFDKDGTKTVWAASGGGFKQQEVELGERNDNFVIIESGVESDDIVALVNPNVAEEEGLSLKKTDDSNSADSDDDKTRKRPRKRPRKR